MAARGGWGEGTLTPLGNGKWKLRLPPYLGRRQITFRADSKTAARKEQRRILDAVYAEAFTDTPAVQTFTEHVEQYLTQHVGDPVTTRKIGERLKTAQTAFGHRPLTEITYDHLAAWRGQDAKRVAPETLYGRTVAVKQVLNAAVLSGALKESPARHLKNPRPQPGLINPFEAIDEVERIAAELPVLFRAVPVFVCMTGLRPEEWAALERSDIRDGSVYVNKRFTEGVFKTGTKNGQAERAVPLHSYAQGWLNRQPPRLDSRLVFPAEDGGYIDLNVFRREVWHPALAAAGVDRRHVKDMRHTFATWQLTGNCNVWHLSKVMGTSVHQIERTYGRWIPGSEQVVLGAMDAFVDRQAAAK
jgi:integrase